MGHCRVTATTDSVTASSYTWGKSQSTFAPFLFPNRGSMPWKAFKENGKYCVYKLDADKQKTGEALGCHPTRKAANKQVAALYVSENKEVSDAEDDMLHAKMIDEGPMWVPPGITSFADLDAYMESEVMADHMRHVTDHFGQIASNIMMNEMVENKTEALSALAKEFTERISQKSMDDASEEKEYDGLDASPCEEERWLDRMANKLKELIGLDRSPSPSPDLFSHIWKEVDGQYHWLAAYTNNYRDNDNPPEIISSDAHKEFDQAVNNGLWPMPEVWLWHIPYPVGQTHYHTYDDKSGFCIAGGMFDKDKPWAAEGIVKAGWQGISHGMPRKEIERNDVDKSIITRRRTREITFLPTYAAANRAAFHIISKEIDDMDEIKEIPAHKREEFVKAFGEERVKQMEEELAQRAQQAKDSGVESKEQTPAPVETTSAPSGPSSDMVEAIQALVTSVKAVAETVTAMDARLKELEKGDAIRLAQKAASLPEASLAAFVKSELFSKANEVKDKGPGPQENESKRDGSTGLFFEEFGWTQPMGRS